MTISGVFPGFATGDFVYSVTRTDAGDTLSFLLFEPFDLDVHLAAARSGELTAPY